MITSHVKKLRNPPTADRSMDATIEFHDDAAAGLGSNIDSSSQTTSTSNKRKRQLKQNKIKIMDGLVNPLPITESEADFEHSLTIDLNGTKWSTNEIGKLLQNLQRCVPKRDLMPFSSRAKKLDWNLVAIVGRSADECRSQWEHIASKVRPCRVMAELLSEAILLLSSLWDFSVKVPTVPRPSHKKEIRKHPDYPKKPLNPYLAFMNKTTIRLKAKHPGWNFEKLSNRAKEKFERLLGEERELLNSVYEDDKERYGIAKKKFLENHPSEERNKPTKQEAAALVFKTDDTFTLPKLPSGPLQHFMRQSGESSNKWSTLPAEIRIKYIEDVLREEACYKEELSIAIARHPKIRRRKFRSKVSRAERLELPIPVTDASSFPLPPVIKHHPYQLFCVEFLGDATDRGRFGSSWMAGASAAWKKKSEAEKSLYGQRIDEIWDKYYETAEEYVATLPSDQQDDERLRLKLKPKRSFAENAARKRANEILDLAEAKPDSLLSSDGNDEEVDEVEGLLTPKMDGRRLFIYENERDFRCTFPKLSDDHIRDRLGQLYDDLSLDEKGAFEKKASRFEDMCF